MEHLPPTREIFKTGIHYILPILLVDVPADDRTQIAGSVGLLVDHRDDLLILLTQNPLKAFFRGRGDRCVRSLKGYLGYVAKA